MRDARYFEGMLSTRDAARILRLKERTLENWRRTGTGPTYSKLGRSVRYSRGAIEAFIVEHEHMAPAEITELLKSFKFR